MDYAEHHVHGAHHEGVYFSATLVGEHGGPTTRWSVTVRRDDVTLGTVPATSRAHARAIWQDWIYERRLPEGLTV